MRCHVIPILSRSGIGVDWNLASRTDIRATLDVGTLHNKSGLADVAERMLAETPSPLARAWLTISLRLNGRNPHDLSGDPSQDVMITALEAQGMQVIPAFAAGLDARPAVEKFFMKDGQAIVDAVVILTALKTGTMKLPQQMFTSRR